MKRMSAKKNLFLVGGVAVAVLAVLALAVFFFIRYTSMRGTCGDELTWVYDGKGTLTISGTGEMEDYGTDILSDAAPWRKLSVDITRVVIEEGVTRIGDNAFWGQSCLNEIELPDSLVSIGDGAFGHCSSMWEIDFPEGLQSIGDMAFTDCRKLNSVTIPRSVTQMGRSTFWGCDALTTVAIEADVVEIGNGMFGWCQNLTYVEFPTSLTHIGQAAFQECRNLKEICIPENVTVIGKGAFNYCTSLSRITFLGDAPSIDRENYGENWIFFEVTANAYFPSNNRTWYNYPAGYLGGDITWIALPN